MIAFFRPSPMIHLGSRRFVDSGKIMLLISGEVVPSNNVTFDHNRFVGAAVSIPANFDRRARKTFRDHGYVSLKWTCFARGVRRVSLEPRKVPSRTTEARA